MSQTQRTQYRTQLISILCTSLQPLPPPRPRPLAHTAAFMVQKWTERIAPPAPVLRQTALHVPQCVRRVPRGGEAWATFPTSSAVERALQTSRSWEWPVCEPCGRGGRGVGARAAVVLQSPGYTEARQVTQTDASLSESLQQKPAFLPPPPPPHLWNPFRRQRRYWSAATPMAVVGARASTSPELAPQSLCTQLPGPLQEARGKRPVVKPLWHLRVPATPDNRLKMAETRLRGHTNWSSPGQLLEKRVCDPSWTMLWSQKGPFARLFWYVRTAKNVPRGSKRA